MPKHVMVGEMGVKEAALLGSGFFVFIVIFFDFSF